MTAWWEQPDRCDPDAFVVASFTAHVEVPVVPSTTHARVAAAASASVRDPQPVPAGGGSSSTPAVIAAVANMRMVTTVEVTVEVLSDGRRRIARVQS